MDKKVYKIAMYGAALSGKTSIVDFILQGYGYPNVPADFHQTTTA